VTTERASRSTLVDDVGDHTFERAWFPSWDYADALRFLDDTWRSVTAGGPMCIATGAHDPPVVTLGRHTKVSEVVDERALAALGARVVRTERGGGATAHMPGQIVVYPVVSLARLRLSVPEFTARLLDAARKTVAPFGVTAEARLDDVGLFVDGRKIAAVGLRARHQVVTHGLSLNVDADLRIFDAIVPCGMPRRPLTTVRRECKRPRDFDLPEIQDRLACEVAAALVVR